MLKLDVPRLSHRVANRERFRTAGKLRSATGVLFTCALPAAIGDLCAILTPDGRELLAEVIGFDRGLASLAPFEQGEIGPDLFRQVCKFGLEGLVSKRADRRYRGGRSPDWVKVKNRTHPAMTRVKEAKP